MFRSDITEVIVDGRHPTDLMLQDTVPEGASALDWTNHRKLLSLNSARLPGRVGPPVPHVQELDLRKTTAQRVDIVTLPRGDNLVRE